MKNKRAKERFIFQGFTLVEVCLSLALIGVCLIWLLLLFSQGMKNASYLRFTDHSALIASRLISQLHVDQRGISWIEVEPVSISVDLSQAQEILLQTKESSFAFERFDPQQKNMNESLYFVKLSILPAHPYLKTVTASVFVQNTFDLTQKNVFVCTLRRKF